MENDQQNNLKVPPSYEEAIILLAQQCAYLSGTVRMLIDGIKRGDSPRKLAYFLDCNWELQKQQIEDAGKNSLIEAERVRAYFGNNAADKLDDRIYLNQLSLIIFSDIANALAVPSFTRCQSCGKDHPRTLDGNFCESCEAFFCEECFQKHNCNLTR